MPEIQVRDCKSAEEVFANYKAVQARIVAARRPKPAPVLVVATPEPTPAPVKPVRKPISLSLIVRLSPGFNIVSDGEEPQPIIIEHSVNRIIRTIAAGYGLTCTEILSERRHKKIVYPRQLAMFVASIVTGRSLPDLGRRFGGRDHTTVLHAIRKIERLRASDPKVAEEIDNLIRAVTA